MPTIKTESPSNTKTSNKGIVSRITKTLLSLLGTPPRLRRVEVKRVGVNVFRVNVVIPNYLKGSYIVSSQRPHSYYVLINEEGNLVFNPPVVKTYF